MDRIVSQRDKPVDTTDFISDAREQLERVARLNKNIKIDEIDQYIDTINNNRNIALVAMPTELQPYGASVFGPILVREIEFALGAEVEMAEMRKCLGEAALKFVSEHSFKKSKLAALPKFDWGDPMRSASEYVATNNRLKSEIEEKMFFTDEEGENLQQQIEQLIDSKQESQ